MLNPYCDDKSIRPEKLCVWNSVAGAFIVGAMAMCSGLAGCFPSSGADCRPMGVCESHSIVANYVLGDTSFVDANVAAFLRFGCAFSFGETWGMEGWGSVDCFDPLTPSTEWESQDWGMFITFDRLGNGEGCGSPLETGRSFVKIVFDVSTGLPRKNTTFEITTASYHEVNTEAWNAYYEITDGQVVIHTAASGRYSYEIKNLTLVKTKDYDSPGFAGCDVPDIVIIESISATCDPEINKGRSC